MDLRIWKYPLTYGLQGIEMPKDCRVLSSQLQDREVCVWALVDSDAETEKRLFEVYPTGHKIPFKIGLKRKFINTLLREDGIVLHVFEVQP